jgi:hypothetical protein
MRLGEEVRKYHSGPNSGPQSPDHKFTAGLIKIRESKYSLLNRFAGDCGSAPDRPVRTCGPELGGVGPEFVVFQYSVKRGDIHPPFEMICKMSV